VGLPNTQIVWLDRSGRPQGTVPVPVGRYESLALSPDGQRLVAGRRSSANSVDLWMIELSRAVATRFTFEPSGACENPVWSPDGQWVAYNSNHAGPRNIYRKLANGAGEEEPLFESSALFKNLSQWTEDGRYLVFNQPDATTGWDVWLLPVAGDRKPVPFLRSRFNEYGGTVSPDGHWMAYGSDESGRIEAYVQSFPTPGSKYQVSTGGAAFGVWSKDGREMGIAGLDGSLLAAQVETAPTFTAGAPRALFKLRPDVVTTTGTPDLQRFLEAVPVGAAAPPSLVLELNWMSALKK
jgi:Tol biopolymer transport system component